LSDEELGHIDDIDRTDRLVHPGTAPDSWG
jgi:hypothetical protein